MMKKRPKMTEQQFDRWAEKLKIWIEESVSPFENDSPEKQKARIDRAKKDKLFFLKTYLPHYFTTEFADFHDDWADFGEYKNECCFVAAPREHGKSTFFSFGDILHDVIFEKRHFILIISDTNDQATGFTIPIKLEFEDNPRIKYDFKIEFGSTNKKNDFVINQTRVLARGRGEKVRGLKFRQYRPDKAVVDDAENDKNVKNPRLVQELKDWLQGAVIGSMGDGYCFLMVGNIFSRRSVLAQFIDETDEHGEPVYLSRIYSAIVDQGTISERSLWPDQWPLERLYQKRKVMGTIIFNREFLNKLIDDDSPFKEAWIQYYINPKGFDKPLGFEQLTIASFLDPSAKNRQANDYKAIITVGLDRINMIFYVLHAWIRHASINSMMDQCYRTIEKYGGTLGIETNMLEDFLRETFHAAARDRKKYLPIQEIKHTTNKEGRIINTLSPLVEFGKIKFQKGQSDQDILIDQLLYLLDKNVHDDGPDALEGAVALLQGTGEISYQGMGKKRFQKKGCY